MADLILPAGGGGGAKSEIKEMDQPPADKNEVGFVEEESEKHQIDRIEDLIADEEEEVETTKPMLGKEGSINAEGAIDVQPATSRKLSAQVESKSASVVV